MVQAKGRDAVGKAKENILSRWKLFEHHFEALAELARKMRQDLELYWESEEKKEGE